MNSAILFSIVNHLEYKDKGLYHPDQHQSSPNKVSITDNSSILGFAIGRVVLEST
jgi:hypothetical protein